MTIRIDFMKITVIKLNTGAIKKNLVYHLSLSKLDENIFINICDTI